MSGSSHVDASPRASPPRPLLATHTARSQSRRVCPCLRWETGAQKFDRFLWTGGGGEGGLDFYFYIFPLVGSVKPLFHSYPEIPDRPGLIATETIKNDSKLNVGLTGTDLWTISHFSLIFSPPPTPFFCFCFCFYTQKWHIRTRLKDIFSLEGFPALGVGAGALRVRDQTGQCRIVGNTNQREGIIRITRLYLLCWMYI